MVSDTTCPLEFEQSAELIVGYAARSLDPEAAAMFERHIKRCPSCREEAALQVAVWAALDRCRTQSLAILRRSAC